MLRARTTPSYSSRAEVPQAAKSGYRSPYEKADCLDHAWQGITYVVLVPAPLAGFEVSTNGRFSDVH
jgi:hypothetical protein